MSRLLVKELIGFEDFPGLLELGKLAFLECEFLTHCGNLLFLLADLLEDDLDRGFLDPGLSSGLGNGRGLSGTHTSSVCVVGCCCVVVVKELGQSAMEVETEDCACRYRCCLFDPVEAAERGTVASPASRSSATVVSRASSFSLISVARFKNASCGLPRRFQATADWFGSLGCSFDLGVVQGG